MTELILTLIVGIIGGTIALRLKVPAGAMVGSMIAVSVFSVITGAAFVPQNLKLITQIAAGAFIGAGIKRKDVIELKLIVKPAILMISIMIILDLLMGYIMYKATGLDLVTALFASAPAGIVDMSLISDDLGADTSKVAVLHLIRLMSVLMFFPALMRFIDTRFSDTKKEKVSDEIAASVTLKDIKIDSEKPFKSQQKLKEKPLNLSITIIVALIAGLAGYSLDIPAGAMTFSMIAVGALNVFTARGFMPLNLRRLTQMLAGALIGSRVAYSDIIALKVIILPAVILLIGILVVNLLIGFIMHKTSSLELITSLLASAPGGLSDMALIAKDLGADAPKVAILHLVRVVTIIGVFPLLIKAITS
jgi:uncharacterized protein